MKLIILFWNAIIQDLENFGKGKFWKMVLKKVLDFLEKF